jgi:hypothetical protein
MSAVSTSPVQSRRSAMVLAMAASMPSLSRVASRLLASNQSLASSSRVLNTMSSTTLGTSRMLLMRLSSGFNCIIFSFQRPLFLCRHSYRHYLPFY